MTITDTDIPGPVACGCSMAHNARWPWDSEEMTELHARLLDVEDGDPVATAALMAEIAAEELWTIDADDVRRFAAEHNWRDPAAVATMFWLVASCMAGATGRD